jgi:hypothetical protein
MKTKKLLHDARGFSAIEVLVVVGLTVTLSSVAMIQVAMKALPDIKSSSAARAVMAQLNIAKELSQSQRRRVKVVFTAPNKIELFRQELPVGTPEKSISRTYLEGRVEFLLTPGLPDTPEAYGKGTATYFGGAANTIIYFDTQGQLVDGTGLPINGTVFLSIPLQPQASRAVAVFGSTGRIRTYRWNTRADGSGVWELS